ncbi:MAG: tRNA (adenosine(37)-N6)-threonylcarbamoyltransferase complex dimerization subunit type 1 TsaB [Myxococcota bacterium]
MLLAIETATREGTVAVLDDAGEIAGTYELGERNHAVTLAPLVASLLEAHGPPDLYAIDAGPGSFTGLRVGMAFLKGLARSRPGPVVPVRSLEVLAAQILEAADASAALPVLEASGQYVFAARYVGGPSGPEVDPSLPVGLYRAEAIAARRDADAVAGGTGVAKLTAHGFAVRVGGERVPRAETVARLAWRRRSEAQPASRLEPEYHQPSAAEANLARALEKQKKP